MGRKPELGLSRFAEKGQFPARRGRMAIWRRQETQAADDQLTDQSASGYGWYGSRAGRAGGWDHAKPLPGGQPFRPADTWSSAFRTAEMRRAPGDTRRLKNRAEPARPRRDGL